MNRRGFMSSILALGAAPAIVRVNSLMRIVPRDRLVWFDDFDIGRTIISPEGHLMNAIVYGSSFVLRSPGQVKYLSPLQVFVSPCAP